MRCPFLREANVRYCRAAPTKKMIIHRPGQPSNERCSSADYVNCPLLRQQQGQYTAGASCPFLDACLVQYCAAASVTKYVPYSESGLSRCGSDSHRYCDLYLAVATAGEDEDDPAARNPGECVGGIHLPSSLWYSSNHLWLDVSPEGVIHLGMDALMAAVLGNINRLEFISARGRCRPALVASARDVDLSVIFPNEIAVTRPNAALRSAPGRVAEHPYGSGWLFEGRSSRTGSGPAPETRNLLSGASAREWMKSELRRLSQSVQELDAAAVLADGGSVRPAQLAQLPRRALLRLYNDFFVLP